MLTHCRRLSALVLTVALAAGQLSICAGWMATPEARMACCADGEACPMHAHDSHAKRSAQVLSQTEADSCCAASEQDDAAPAAAAVAVVADVVSLGPVSLVPAACAQPDAWRTLVPAPGPHLHKHLLLSVFLL